MTEHLKALGTSTVYKFDSPDKSILETFDVPQSEELSKGSLIMQLHIESPEFTSLCPKTGQPDFATIVLTYVPDKKCIESKSYKLYLMSFRNHGAFHEACVHQIAHDLVAVLDPMHLTVCGKFAPRGGIPFWPTVEYRRYPQFVTHIVAGENSETGDKNLN